MHYLTKKGFFVVLMCSMCFGVNPLNAENLYSCTYNGQVTTYHEDEAKRMQVLGADCRIMDRYEHITCSMRGARVSYSREEAEELLATYPEANCEINDRLFISLKRRVIGEKALTLKNRLTIYFPINGNMLSKKNLDKVKRFAKLHRNMGYTYTITGFASATGSSSKNHTLSLKRAGNARDTLLAEGINENNILSVDALGEESLRYNTKYEERRNRAVEIKAFGPVN